MTMDNYARVDGEEAPVMNQSGILGVLKVEFSRARRYGCPLACMLIQIDRFEYLGDLYGMEIATALSDSIVEMINGNTRLSDFLGKIGERYFPESCPTRIATDPSSWRVGSVRSWPPWTSR